MRSIVDNHFSKAVSSRSSFQPVTPAITALDMIVVSNQTNTQSTLVGIGGTSLASPIFTAMWAIASARAGHPLGLASSTIAALKKGMIDILPTTAAFSGECTNSSSGTPEKFKTGTSILELLVTLLHYPEQPKLVLIYDQPQYLESTAVAFGFDTSFAVTPNRHNATSYGTPHGLDFINANAAATY